MGPQEDYIETVVTCEGDFNDPGLPDRLQSFKDELESLLLEDKKKQLLVKKVEPWNSVKVTLNVPKQAALRLRQLVEQRAPILRSIGLLGVQFQGDCLVSMTVARPDNQQAEVVIRTPDADQSHHPPLSASVTGSATTTAASARPLSSLQEKLSPAAGSNISEGQLSSLIPSSLVAGRLATGPSFEARRLAALDKEPPLERNNISNKEVHPSLERVVSSSTQSHLAAVLLNLGASSGDNVMASRSRANGDQNPPFHYPLLQQPVQSAGLQPMVSAPFHQQHGSPQDVALPHTAAAGSSLTSQQVTTLLPLPGAKGTNKTRKNGRKRNKDATKDVSDSELMKETINNGLVVNDKPTKKARRRRTDKQVVASGSSIDCPSTVSMNGSQKAGKRTTFSDGSSQGNNHIQGSVGHLPMRNAALVSAAQTQKASKGEEEDSLVNPHTGIMEPRNSCGEFSGDSAYALPMSPVTDRRNVLTAVHRKMSPMYRVQPPAPSWCSSTSGPPISHQALAADPYTRPHLIPAGQGNRTGLGQAVSCQIGSHQPSTMIDPQAKKPRLLQVIESHPFMVANCNRGAGTSSPSGSSRLWSDGENSNSPINGTLSMLGPVPLHGKLEHQDSGLGSQSDRSLDTTPSDAGGGLSPLSEPPMGGKAGVEMKKVAVNCGEVPLQDPMLSVGNVQTAIPASIPGVLYSVASTGHAAARSKDVLESWRQRPLAEGGQFRKIQSQEPPSVRQQEQDVHTLASSAITARHQLLQQASAVLASSKDLTRSTGSSVPLDVMSRPGHPQLTRWSTKVMTPKPLHAERGSPGLQAGQDRKQAISGVPCVQQPRISPPPMMPQSSVSAANGQRLLQRSRSQANREWLQTLKALHYRNGSLASVPNGSMSSLCVPPTSTMPGHFVPPSARNGVTAAPSVAADSRDLCVPPTSTMPGHFVLPSVCNGVTAAPPSVAVDSRVSPRLVSSLGAAGQRPVCQSGPGSVGQQRSVEEQDRVNQLFKHLCASPYTNPPSTASQEGAALPEDLRGLYDSPANKGSHHHVPDLLNVPLDTDPEQLPDIHQIVDQLKSDFAVNNVPANTEWATNITATRFPQPPSPVSVGVLNHKHPAGLPQPRRLTESVQRVVQPLPAQDNIFITGSRSTHARPGISHHGSGSALGVAGQSEVKSGMDSTWVPPASTFQGQWAMNPTAYGVKPRLDSPGVSSNASPLSLQALMALQSPTLNRNPSHGPVRTPHLQASLNQQVVSDWRRSPGCPVVGEKTAAAYVGTVGMGPSPAAALGADVSGRKQQTKAKAKKNGNVTRKNSLQQ